MGINYIIQSKNYIMEELYREGLTSYIEKN